MNSYQIQQRQGAGDSQQQHQQQQQQQYVLQQHQIMTAQGHAGMQDASKSSFNGSNQSNNMMISNTQQKAQFDNRQQEPETWAQKMNYSQVDQRSQEFIQQNNANMQAKNRRGSTNEAHQSKTGSATVTLDLNTQHVAPGVAQRHGSAKHQDHNSVVYQQDKRGAAGFFGSAQADSAHGSDKNKNIDLFLNKTQVIQSGSIRGADPKHQLEQSSNSQGTNERANRINLHRSNRQRSHQGHQQQEQSTGQYYDKTGSSKNGQNNGVPEVKIQLANSGKQMGNDLDVVYYQGNGHNQVHVQPESAKNSSSQYNGNHFQQYETQGEGLNEMNQMIQRFEASQDELQKFKQSQHLQSSNKHNNGYTETSSLQNSKQSIPHSQHQQMQLQQQQYAHQQAPEAHLRRGSEATSHAGKKKVQPPQPRNREESTSRRSGAAAKNIHNKSSETTNSYDQSSQNSSTGIQQPQSQAQQYQNLPQTNQQQISTDKFSQLVCQVPQGANQPQMSANSQSIPKIQVQDSANGNYSNQYLLGPQRPSEAGRKTLVLDLDETLVHSSFKPVENADIMLPVEIDGQICTIYVLIRPFVAQFLKRMHKVYELVIFTASLSKYAEPLMTHLDPQKMCSYLLFREHCTFFNNAYVKDLTRLGRPMKDVIIVDNSPVAYLFQPENAMPAVSWYDDPSDTELNRIDALLHRLALEDDVRKVIRTIISNNKIDPKQEQLYLASSAAQHRRDKSQRVDRRTKQPAKLHASNAAASHQDNQMTTMLQNKAKEQHSSQHHQQKEQVSYAHQKNDSIAAMAANSQSNDGSTHQQQQQAAAGAHSRYDSSDTRQRNAALISEEMNQRKRGEGNNLNMEIVLSNVQKLTQQASDLQYQSNLKKGMQQNQHDIQQAYQHHKNQIMQLKNEIAALKSQQTGTSPRSAAEQAEVNATHDQQAQVVSSSHRRTNADVDGHHHRADNQGHDQIVAPSSAKHAKTAGQVQRVVHQQIGDNAQMQEYQKSSPVKTGNKGQKQREGSRRHHDQADGGQPTVVPKVAVKSGKQQAQQQSRQSYKILSTNEIQLVNYLKNNNDQSGHSQNAGTSGVVPQQRHSINVDKKQIVVRESLANNSQLHNTKQIIKLIKKSEGHQSNQELKTSAAGRKNLDSSGQQPQASQPNIQPTANQTGAGYSQQHHPATTKSQTKQHFAFTTHNQGSSVVTNGHQDGSRQVRQSQPTGQPFSGQINMIQSTGVAARGQQASRTSSKTTKNYSTATATSNTGNIRTSYSSSKHGAHASKGGQSSLQAHERMSAPPGSTTQTKRSSSVKTNSQGHHQVRRQSSDKDHHHQGTTTSQTHQRKGNNSATHQNNSGVQGGGYSNLGAYEMAGHHHHRRERGSSAQPLYSGSSHGPNANPLLVTNLVNRSSSTTNKNKKVNSISGTGNIHNLVLNGSHSTKHSTQQAHANNPSTQQVLQSNQHRGGSHDRHQQKASSSSRQPARLKSASNKNSNNAGHGSDSKDEHHHHYKQSKSNQQHSLKQQQEHLQRVQQMQQVPSSGKSAQQQQQLSATQRISPGTMLSLAAQYVGGQGQNNNSQQQLSSNLTPSNHQQQAQAIVKQNLKDIQVQDMLRLTQSNTTQGPAANYFQTGMSSTRNQKQAAQIGGHNSVQQQDTDDFLKKLKLQQQAAKGSKDQHHVVERRTTEKQSKGQQAQGTGSNITIMHQEGTISKSSQGHQSMGQVVNSLTINSPKYVGGQHASGSTGMNPTSTRDQQKILLNDIMNMSSMQREQKSGSAATSYATKQQIHHITASSSGNNAGSGTNGHQIKKIRISSSNQQNNTGRISGRSNQSAPNHHKSSGLKRGDSNHSRGSHSSAIHQVIRTSNNGGNSGQAGASTKSRDQGRQAHMLNQTMKLKDSNARGTGSGGGIMSLLGDMAGSDSQEKDLKNQTAADLFLKTHNEEQFSQTQYIGSAAGSHHLGHNQLREVTRHFYNQISNGGGQGAVNDKKQSRQ